MADFNFIVIPELRSCLETDYKEIQACLKAQAWKAVHVLAGSVIEAVLIDALSSEAGVNTSNLESMELGPLVALAKEKAVLSEEAVDLSTVVRKYRNLIHPGRIKRLEKVVDKSGAIVAAQLVEIITAEVAKRKRATYGYTAEQLLERLESGDTALPLVGHLLGDARKPEIERLLIDLLPQAYTTSIGDQDSPVEHDRHLATCYRKVFEAAPDDIKEKVMKEVSRVYRQESESTVLTYEETFLRSPNLKYLTDAERKFIKAHLLPRVDTESLDRLFPTIRGIGGFLDAEEATNLAITMLNVIAGEDADVTKKVRLRFFNEYDRMTDEGRAAVRALVETGFEDKDMLDKLTRRDEKRELGSKSDPTIA